MTTVDNLPISVYNLYAMRTRMVEQINQQLRLGEAASIPPQTQMVDIYPKLSELDILLGIVPLHAPWAYFFPPQKFRFLRRSPFAFSWVAIDEDSEDLLEKLESVECHTPEEKQEKAAIAACCKQVDEINSWLGFIIGRVGQFLQG